MIRILKKKRIKKNLSESVFGRNIEYMPVCDSTNELAKRKSDMPHGTVFIADEQTKGKGRLGRSWESEKKSGICMSVLIKDDIPLSDVAQLTLIAGVAVCRALGYDTKIKWPNDVVIGSRKVSGILTERSGDAVICGIGINVNTKEFPPELRERATSLFIESGEKHDRDYICALVLNEFELLYNQFKEGGFAEIYGEYFDLCVTLGNDVVAIRDGAEITGFACGISPEGGLIIDTEEGEITVSSGEVSVRGMYGYI